jgi:hypothetical protein
MAASTQIMVHKFQLPFHRSSHVAESFKNSHRTVHVGYTTNLIMCRGSLVTSHKCSSDHPTASSCIDSQQAHNSGLRVSSSLIIYRVLKASWFMVATGTVHVPCLRCAMMHDSHTTIQPHNINKTMNNMHAVSACTNQTSTIQTGCTCGQPTHLRHSTHAAINRHSVPAARLRHRDAACSMDRIRFVAMLLVFWQPLRTAISGL